jgi:hypothetical protein
MPAPPDLSSGVRVENGLDPAFEKPSVQHDVSTVACAGSGLHQAPKPALDEPRLAVAVDAAEPGPDSAQRIKDENGRQGGSNVAACDRAAPARPDLPSGHHSSSNGCVNIWVRPIRVKVASYSQNFHQERACWLLLVCRFAQ